ncbi:MAG: VWA domain-containing protein [Candidatus Aminicenantes bacterium]|nr:VWA domain-containing protein [Candidatus Aminicenantes bacterium]
MKQFRVLTALIVMVGLAALFAAPSSAQQDKPKPKPLIQLAILLDTSNSMDGLIDQAKTQLWKIVNEMALAKQQGASPRLEVALYEYGNDGLPAGESFMRLIVPLSEDLDRISEELFKLKTNGGSEYCGTVIQSASDSLKWSKNNNDLKAIFIAGNEPFTQGQVDYKNSCKKAITNGIIVNTIFCGNFQEGVNTQWKDGADLADGKYMNIDSNQIIVEVAAPQDKEIIDLGKKMNETYVAYGDTGAVAKKRQSEQDANAASVNDAVMAQRAMTKGSAQYANASWDLVDAEKEGKVDVEKLDEKSLPEEMKKMSKEERKQYIEKKKKERADIQAKINLLREERDKYVAEQRKKEAGDKTLDQAMIDAIRAQAAKKNYKFEK